MTTDAERLARLEGAYEHLATKADLKDLELRLTSDLRSLETRLTVRLMLVVSLATGVVVAVDRLWNSGGPRRRRAVDAVREVHVPRGLDADARGGRGRGGERRRADGYGRGGTRTRTSTGMGCSGVMPESGRRDGSLVGGSRGVTGDEGGCGAVWAWGTGDGDGRCWE